MNTTARSGAWMAALAFMMSSPLAQAPTEFDLALQAYVRQDFRSAFERLAGLADAGHGDAARMALLMAAHGPRLFSQRFEVVGQRRERWLDAAAAALPQAAPISDHN
jgi:hypothetical protein